MHIKKIIIALFLILFVNHLFAEGFSIIESTPGTKYSFEIKKGFLVKEGTISIKDRKIHTVFVLDTGACSSSYDSYVNPEFSKIIEEENDIVSAEIDGIAINDWKIRPYSLNSKLMREYPDGTFFVLLGNDVLMHKSLYLSILDGYFYWGENQNASLSYTKRTLETHEENRFGQNYYRYKLCDCDSHFSMEENAESKYIIDSGMYVASFGNKEYSAVVNNKKYVSFNHPAVPNGNFYHFGVCKVDEPVVLGEKFDYLYYSCGYNPLNEKAYGVQVLAAFDLYFECTENTIPKVLYLYPQEKSKYESFRMIYDNDSSVQNFTYGFNISFENRITMKFYVDNKELYPEIEENDEVIEFIEKNNFAYITLKKASGKKVRFKIKKFVL